MNANSTRLVGVIFTLILVASACGSGQSSGESSSDTTTTQATGDSSATVGIEPDAFFDGALTKDIKTSDCTLASGVETSCYELTVAGFPATRDEFGPWCPKTTSDTAEAGGIWFDGKASYEIDGQFILDLAETYDDPTWKLYDEDGNVLSTDTSEKFNDLVTGAPQDDADADPVNLCVYGEIEWADGGKAIPATVQIPVTPTMADDPTAVSSKVGITLDGVSIEGSAPIDLILGNYTIGAFDDCGGHVNPQEGYHLHAATGCSDSTQKVADDETAMFGYALDGYAIHEPYEADLEAAADLDACNGHETDDLGYHYHANQVAENAVLTCFSGETTESTADGPGDGGTPPNGGGPPVTSSGN